MTMMPGSIRPTSSTDRSTNPRISVAAERLVAISSGGSARTMSGPSWATAAASSGESAQTSVARPTSRARTIARWMSPSVIRRSEWLSSVPTAPASLSASGSTLPTPRPTATGSMCWAKTRRRSVARGDGRDVDRLRVEDDADVELPAQAVRRLGQAHGLRAVDVPLEPDLEDRRADSASRDPSSDDDRLDAEHPGEVEELGRPAPPGRTHVVRRAGAQPGVAPVGDRERVVPEQRLGRGDRVAAGTAGAAPSEMTNRHCPSPTSTSARLVIGPGS